MTDVQKGLLLLMKEFDTICRMYSITYYLEGGTLLGAVRHHGFIPWDDDADLCMSRDNFDRLLSIIDNALPEGRELVCRERFSKYSKSTVKYVNTNTTTIFRDHVLDGLACGQHIDLFILDPVPTDLITTNEFRVLSCVYSEIMMPYYLMNRDDIVQSSELYQHYLKMQQFKGRNYTLTRLYEQLYSFEDTDACELYCLRWGQRCAFFRKSFFGTPVPVDFEGNLFPAPQYKFRLLHAEFGETWMIVPKEEKQQTHFTYSNMNFSCAQIIDDYQPFINRKQALRNYRKRKALNIKKYQLLQKLTYSKAQLSSIKEQLELKTLLEALPNSDTVADEFHNTSYFLLYQRFLPYYAAQLNPTILAHSIMLPIADDVLYSAVYILIMNGQYYKASDLLQLYRVNNVQLPEKFNFLQSLVEALHEFVLATEEQRFIDADSLVRTWLPRAPFQLDMKLYDLRFRMDNEIDLFSLLQEARDLLEQYPESGETMKLMGDLCAQYGDSNGAKQWYIQTAQHTQNGLTLLTLPKFSESL